MLGKNTILSGVICGAIFATASFSTPASAGQLNIDLEFGIESLLNDLTGGAGNILPVQSTDFNGVPIRRIHRKLRRRGLFPVSDYRLRGDVVILRAEDDFGTIFRVVADADYGDILRIRRVRSVNNYRPRPVEPPYYDDNYNRRPGIGNSHAQRKAARDAKRRAAAQRKAARDAKAQRRAAKEAKAKRLAAQQRADAARRANQANAEAKRRAAQAAADRNRRASANKKKPYLDRNDPNLGDYERRTYGSGR